jgi:hypothetical protein
MGFIKLNSFIIFIMFLATGTTTADQTINSSVPNDTPDNRYVIKNDGTVIDKLTGLMWQRCMQGLTGEDCTEGEVEFYTWQQALQFSTGATLASYDDWRLPNIEELRSLAAYDRIFPSINAVAFPNTLRSEFCWSSSVSIHCDDCAWAFRYNSAYDFAQEYDTMNYVKLVRGQQ